MSWLQIRIQVSRQQAQQAEALLQSLQALSVTLMDAADSPVLEPGVGETPLWPQVSLSALFPADTPAATILTACMQAGIIQRPSQLTTETLEDQAWERAWLERFRPMDFGGGLWVVPGDIPPPREAETVLRLDPGLAFGTGTHPTTALCLEWLAVTDLQGQTVVDYGCGSGILAVAAALQGAKQVYAVDNDPQALLATQQNAAANGVADRIQCLLPQEFGVRGCDLVLANILAGILVELKATLLGCLADGGTLALSGLLQEQEAVIKAAYGNHVVWRPTRCKEDWIFMPGQYHNSP